MFFIPTRTNHNQADHEKGPAERIMEWHVLKDLSWGILLLLGCGFALADVAASTRLTDIIADELIELEKVPLFILLLICCGFCLFLTELFSNTATANVLLPIISTIAITLKINPFVCLPNVELTFNVCEKPNRALKWKGKPLCLLMDSIITNNAQ